MAASAATAAVSPAERQRAERRDPAAEHEPGDASADQHLGLVASDLATPVGQHDDLTPKLLERGAELLAIGLDREADLLGAPNGGHQLPSEVLVATVSRI